MVGCNIFLSWRQSQKKIACPASSALGGVTEVDTDPKTRFLSFTLLPLMTELSVFMLLQGIAPGNSWLGDASLKDYKIIWKIKQYLENSTVIRIKWREMVEIKYFIDVVLIMTSQKSSRRENPDSSDFTCNDRSSGTWSRIGRVYTHIRTASNSKINHIMVTITNHYNTIFIDRFPSKTKIGKYSWHFNKSFFYVSPSSP